MTRIVLDRSQLQAAATRFIDVAADVESMSLRLSGAPLPELPAGFGDLAPTLAQIAQRLDSQAMSLLDEARMLRQRAALAELGAAMAYALKQPGAKGLSGKKLMEWLKHDPGVTGALAAVNIADGTLLTVAASTRWRRLMELRAARASWSDLVNPSLFVHGSRDYRTLKAYFGWQETVSHTMPLEVAQSGVRLAAGSDEEAKFVEGAFKLGKGGKALELGGKAVAPLDAGLSLYTLVRGSDYKGTRGDIDRGVAGASFVADALVISAVVAPVPLAGEVVAGAVLTIAGLWTAGNLIADNQKAIARGLTTGASFVAGHPTVGLALGPEAVPAVVGAEIWDHRQTVESAGGWVADQAVDVGRGAKDLGDGIATTVSKAEPWHWGL